MDFPNWRRRVHERFPVRRRSARLRGGNEHDEDEDFGIEPGWFDNPEDRAAAFDLVQEVLDEAGLPSQATRRSIVDPFSPGSRIPAPNSREELVGILEQLEDDYGVLFAFNQEQDALAEQEEAELINIAFGDQEPEQILDAEPLDLPADALAGDIQEYCLRGFYVQQGDQNPDIYARFTDVTVTIDDPADIALLLDDLGDVTRGALLRRAQLFHKYALGSTLNDLDDYDEETGRAYLDAQIISLEACADDASAPTLELQEGSGRRARHVPSSAVPNTLNPVHERNRYRNPFTRRSFNARTIRVDHPAIVYPPDDILTTPQTQEYRDPWLRHNIIEDCCWMNAIIDLINVGMNRTFITYEKLWQWMGMPGAFDPVRARQGFSVEDMVPLFEHLDRSVKVFDGERNLIYERKCAGRRMKHIRPRCWSFLVTEHHVYILDRQLTNRAILRINSHTDVYDEICYEHPYERLSPLLPTWESRPPAIIRNSEQKAHKQRWGPDKDKPVPPTKIVFLSKEGIPEDTHTDYASLSDILFASKYEGDNLHVVVQANMINNVLLELVTKYRYRPSVTGSTSGINSILIQSLANRGEVRFMNPIGYKGDNRGHLPDPTEDLTEDNYFESKKQYLDYVKASHSFYTSIAKPELTSSFHESTANVFRSLVRGGVFGWTVPPAIAATSGRENWCSLDVNRIYPSTLQTNMLPTCTVFDRFEQVPDGSDPTAFLSTLNELDLVLIYTYDRPTVYLDRGASLCYVFNLERFVSRPDVVLVDEKFQPTHHAQPSSHTYIRIVAVLRTTPRKAYAWEAVTQAWGHEHDPMPRRLKKKVLVRGLGRLGKSYNTKQGDAHIFCNPEEATVFAQERKGTVKSIQDELFVAFEQGDCVPRLEGHYLIHLFILDTYRAMMQHWYDKIQSRGVQILYVRCDEFFFHETDMPKVEDLIYEGQADSLDAFGMLKVGHSAVPLDQLGFPSQGAYLFTEFLSPSDTHYEISSVDTICPNQIEDSVVPVEAKPSEFEIENLDSFTRLLVQASVPGAGKSHAVLSRYGKDVVVVCPTNALCVEFTAKYPGCTAMTLHKFLRVSPNWAETRVEDGQNRDPWAYIGRSARMPEHNKVLLLDEIYMYSQSMLSKLYFRLSVTGATRVFATGDPNQLPPINEEVSEELFLPTQAKTQRMKSVSFMFPHQMTLHVCKRGNDPEDNKRMQRLTQMMRSPGFSMEYIVDMIKEEFNCVTFREATQMMKGNPMGYVAVCYYNRTCHQIAKSVLPGGTKLREGVRLVNRRRANFAGGTLMVNYEYNVKEVQERYCVLEDVMIPGSEIKVSNMHIERNMHWSQTRTCHSLQGSSVSSSLLLFNLMSHRVSPEFVYVALTRARKLGEVWYVDNGDSF